MVGSSAHRFAWVARLLKALMRMMTEACPHRHQAVGGLLLGGEGAKARLAMIGAVVLARTLLQDRIASLNGASVEHVLRQDRPAFVRLIGRSIVQVRLQHLSLVPLRLPSMGSYSISIHS